MKNKELAYDYIHSYLFKDAGVADQVPGDQNLETDDREALLEILGTIGDMAANSSKYNQLLQQENQKIGIKANEMALSNMENTYQTIISIKTSLQQVIGDLKRAFNYVMLMYLAAFLLGVGLIVVSVVFAVQGKTILSIAFGAIGLADLVAYFIFKPPLEIQNSRSNLIQLMIVVTNWFADLMNLNTYMGNKMSEITLDEIKKISETLNDNTAKMLELIEKYGEVRKD